ncbi:Primase, C-terminal 2 [uncultured Caudovirales phage]|uniref:Primase, C-terminal 2 n=1 Tax=uncultured Caudovirales phage TaxID=2100421 RepID=A0A6J7VJN4_9CAUD|nr:Primase, C-terminal 2 [uncultured Caudovirales phage]
MTSVTTISPHLTQIECPDLLRGLQGWLTWRFEEREGEAKQRKVPYYAGGGRRGAHGTPDDRNRLVTFEAAIAAAARRGHAGVGLAMLADWGLVALDFDNAASAGAVRDDVELMLHGTYAEFSPSGLGVRAFVQGVSPNKKSFEEPYGFETFCSSGFVTFTGNRLPSVDYLGNENTIAPMSDQVRQLIADRLLKGRDPREKPVQSGERLGYTDEQLTEMLKAIDPDEHGYERWYQIGMALHHETDAEGFDLFDEWSSQGADYPGREALQRKWDSFGNNAGAPTTIRALMKWAGEAGATVGAPVASVDDFDVIEDTPEEKAVKVAKAGLFQVIPAADFSTRPPPRYLIQDVLPKADLAIVYGDSGSGKSFVVTDLAMSIARGEAWRGKKVQKGRVVYIVAEGGGGYSLRLRAYAQHHELELEGLPFGIINAAPNLLTKDDVKDVISSIKAYGGADLVIIDTLAQTTPGANENAAEDMGLAIKNARAIARAAGGMALLVHHSGKDASKGARGWSGMRAAADAQLEVVRLENGVRVIQTTKQKDGKDDGRWGFRLEDVMVGLDEEGDALVSCVVVEADAPAPSKKGEAPPRKLGVWEAVVLETFAEMQLGGDVMFPALVIAAADKRPDAGTVKQRRKDVRRAIEGLSTGKNRRLDVEENYVFEVRD